MGGATRGKGWFHVCLLWSGRGAVTSFSVQMYLYRSSEWGEGAGATRLRVGSSGGGCGMEDCVSALAESCRTSRLENTICCGFLMSSGGPTALPTVNEL